MEQTAAGHKAARTGAGSAGGGPARGGGEPAGAVAAGAGDAREVDLGYARLDVGRAARTGDPEVVYGAGKTPAQTVGALRALALAHPGRTVLATRLDEEARALVRRELPGAEVDDLGRTATLGPPGPRRGRVAVVCAGTADLPVLRECATTVRAFGAEAEEIVDVGVSGLHRLLARMDRIAACDVVVAVAGMEAALPSVLGGLTGLPLIAVPTSVGYGWHLDGLTAWLATLNSCAAGVLSVNVDNGFGAGVAAARIARGAERTRDTGDVADRARPACAADPAGGDGTAPAWQPAGSGAAAEDMANVPGADTADRMCPACAADPAAGDATAPAPRAAARGAAKEGRA
jgi:NCAIR mutase (PurE)-related protein